MAKSKSKSKNLVIIKKLRMEVKEYQDKMFDVFKQSIQDLVEEASLPEMEDGKMHVDTGFLRSSGVASINQLPEGPVEGRRRKKGEIGVLSEYSNYNPATTILSALIKLKPTDTLYFGWTAHYASIRELYDGFLESAVQNWPFIVEKNAKRVLK